MKCDRRGPDCKTCGDTGCPDCFVCLTAGCDCKNSPRPTPTAVVKPFQCSRCDADVKDDGDTVPLFCPACAVLLDERTEEIRAMRPAPAEPAVRRFPAVQLCHRCGEVNPPLDNEGTVMTPCAECQTKARRLAAEPGPGEGGR